MTPTAADRARHRRRRRLSPDLARCQVTPWSPLPSSTAVIRRWPSYRARNVTEGCDHTRRFSERWAREQGVDWEPLRQGLDEFGGFCDCEVVINCDAEAVSVRSGPPVVTPRRLNPLRLSSRSVRVGGSHLHLSRERRYRASRLWCAGDFPRCLTATGHPVTTPFLTRLT
ncbi:DUF2695 domain-containing protein [Micromonospora sp. NPDC007271]|uniref:DUF2695 domain-containing protein n=1 Tax=Micromonospora sp. NPDC007271 TaxID=3154587 RepID=UPI0033EF5F28